MRVYKDWIKGLLKQSTAFRALTGRLYRRTPILLLYHHFSKQRSYRSLSGDSFEKQILYLRSNFNLYNASELVDYKVKHGVWPVNAAVITVDDGYADFYEVAFPILVKYNVPATLYVATSFVNKERLLWPDILEHALFTSTKKEIFVKIGGLCNVFPLTKKTEKKRAWSLIGDELLKIKPSERDHFLNNLQKNTGVVAAGYDEKHYTSVDWDQLKIMLRSGLVEIGSHTCNHPILSTLDVTDAIAEIRESKFAIESMLGVEVTSFSYPNGQKDDYNKNIIEEVKSAGYQNAVVAYYDKGDSLFPYEIQRHTVGENYNEFLCTVQKVNYFLKKVSPKK